MLQGINCSIVKLKSCICTYNILELKTAMFIDICSCCQKKHSIWGSQASIICIEFVSVFSTIGFVFIPTTPPAAASCSGWSWDCSASPSMVFERMHSSVAARLSLEAWTLHWTGVFQQTETLQASAITQKESICFIFLVQISYMFKQTTRCLQITNAGSTNNIKACGGILRHSKFTSSLHQRDGGARESLTTGKKNILALFFPPKSDVRSPKIDFYPPWPPKKWCWSEPKRQIIRTWLLAAFRLCQPAWRVWLFPTPLRDVISWRKSAGKREFKPQVWRFL